MNCLRSIDRRLVALLMGARITQSKANNSNNSGNSNSKKKKKFDLEWVIETSAGTKPS